MSVNKNRLDDRINHDYTLIMNTKYKNLYSTTMLMVAMSVIVIGISYVINKDPLNPSQANLFAMFGKVFGGITILLILASIFTKFKK